MTTDEQRRKARTLRDLHSGPAVLVLPNVWDPIGARVLASKAYPAVATASAAISASPGFEDGEKIARRTMLEVVRRISRAVPVPVTADMEAGYGATVAELEDTSRGLVDAGAVGMNIEDSLVEGGPLRPVADRGCRGARRSLPSGRSGLHIPHRPRRCGDAHRAAVANHVAVERAGDT